MHPAVYNLFGLSLFVIVFSVITESSANLAQNGTNVCSRSVSFRQSYQQSYQVSYKYRTTVKCGILNWGRCTRYRIGYRTQYRTATRISYRKQYYCCKGWSQVGDQCTKAICTQPCVNGTCTKPDYCSCYSGYYGKLCERDCPSHKWGPHCKHDCLCQNNAKCSPHTGICTCTPGWEGQYCDKPCDPGYYGNRCQSNCTCPNGVTCDPVNGDCACAAGYRGKRCESECSLGWYGQDCRLKCACLNGALCDHVTGVCDCRPGYRGKRCEYICKEGTFGQSCQENCACHNNASCSHINGSCICTPGYTGKHCGHHVESQLLSYEHDKQTGTSGPLVHSLAAGISVVFIIILIVLAYFYYRKRKKPHIHKTTNSNPNEHIYASAEGPRSSSGLEEATEITDETTALNGNQETESSHVYQSPTARPTTVNGSDVKVAMGTHYMDLGNQSSLESNTYESLNKETMNKNQLKVAVYDVPVVKKKPNAYEEIKLNKNSSEREGHYYKGLERPSTSRADENADQSIRKADGKENHYQTPNKEFTKENHYQTPNKEFTKKEKNDEEAFGYATPK